MADAVQSVTRPRSARRRACAVATNCHQEAPEGTLHRPPPFPTARRSRSSAKRTGTQGSWSGQTGQVKRRILKSGISSAYETTGHQLQANWSPDGKYYASAKRGPRDDIVIVDVARNNRWVGSSLLSGVTTPS